jgi:hypothetical protein
MLIPHLLARIEEKSQLAGLRIDRCNITAFVAITLKTGKSQVVELVAPPCFSAMT